MSKGIQDSEVIIADLKDKLDIEITNNIRVLMIIREIQRALNEEEIQKYCYNEIARADAELFLNANNVYMDRNFIPEFMIKIIRRFAAEINREKELR